MRNEDIEEEVMTERERQMVSKGLIGHLVMLGREMKRRGLSRKGKVDRGGYNLNPVVRGKPRVDRIGNQQPVTGYPSNTGYDQSLSCDNVSEIQPLISGILKSNLNNGTALEESLTYTTSMETRRKRAGG